MHLFLVQQNTLGGFAHLHPTKRQRMLYECPLPSLPAGRYDLYADVTYETGSTETLTNSLRDSAACFLRQIAVNFAVALS